jgi:hypothetical protein
MINRNDFMMFISYFMFYIKPSSLLVTFTEVCLLGPSSETHYFPKGNNVPKDEGL